MENEAEFLPEDEKIQLEYLESLLTNLTIKNVKKVVRKIRNIQFKTRNQLQHLSDLIFKFVHERPDKIKEYAHLCGEIKDLKVTILRFETVDEKESVEIANLQFHILLTTRVEIAYDQLGAVKDSFEFFLKQNQNGSLIEVLRFVKNQITFAGALYKHDLVTTEFLFAVINKLSLMTDMSEFFLECIISLMEQIAKDVEARNYSLGRYFKQLKNIAKNKETDSWLKERIKDLLKLRATRWLGGEEEVPQEFVENIIIDENYKQKNLKSIVEELAKYISLDRCRSCCLEFKPSDRIHHLTSKQHTTSMQTLLRDQYDGNLISCRERSCIICQVVDIERPFVHFKTQKHKINSTTFCYICHNKFTSAFYLSMHLKSLSHRKEILRMYDSMLKTSLLSELIAKENDILASDASDDNDDGPPFDYARYDRSMNENALLKNNIFKYLNLITAEELTKNKQGLHELIMEQLDRFIDNIYISKNISTENTLELLKQFIQEAEDVKAAVKCVKGQFPPVGETKRKEMVEQHKIVKLLKGQYAELCEDMQKKVAELSRVRTEQELSKLSVQEFVHKGIDNLQIDDKSKDSVFEEKYRPQKSQEYIPQRSNFDCNKGIHTITENTPNCGKCDSNPVKHINDLLDELLEGAKTKNFGSKEKNRNKDTYSKNYLQRSKYQKKGINKTSNSPMKTSSSSVRKHRVQLNDGPAIGENDILTAAYSGIETQITVNKEKLQKTANELVKDIGETVSATKITNTPETNSKNNSSEFKTNQNNTAITEKHDDPNAKKITSCKNKRTSFESKSLRTDKCAHHKTKVPSQEKCHNNVADEPKVSGTTRWHVMDDSIESYNRKSDTIENNFNSKQHITNTQNFPNLFLQFRMNVQDNSCTKGTIDQINKDVDAQNKINPINTVDDCSINHATEIKTLDTVLSTTEEIGYYSENASYVAQSNEELREENNIPEKNPLFNLEKTKMKVFEGLKRKIPEKLRTGDSKETQCLHEERIVTKVTSLIKEAYMSEDIPLGLTMGLFENFNRDLESKIKDLEKMTTEN